MLTTIRSLLESPDTKKLEAVLSLHHKITEYDHGISDILSVIEDIYHTFHVFPTLTSLGQEVALLNSPEASSTYQQISGSSPITQESDFYTHVRTLEKLGYEQKIQHELSNFQAGLAQLPNKSTESITKYTDEAVQKISKIKSVFTNEDTSSTSLFYGQDAVLKFRQRYSDIQKHKDSDDALYVNLGIKGAFEDCQLKKGDLFTMAAFTSQGKSVILRWLTYRLLTVYHYNCLFLSLEMSHDVVQTLFFILHANNKDIFPGTPTIIYDSYKNGTLSEEEYDFLFNVAAPDFTNNENYGTLYLEQPSNTKYRLSDLEHTIQKVESDIMPVDAVAVDYISLMWPLETQRGSAQVEDYNNLIKTFKNMAVTHKNHLGEHKPFLAMTPAQISRQGYNEALKTENKTYELSAIWKLTEFERSADSLMTILLTPEFRKQNKMQVQLLKNRDGNLNTDPVEVYCDIGSGGHIQPIEQRSQQQTVEALRSLDI